MVKLEWNECLACKCMLHNRDKSAHSDICTEELALDTNLINLSSLKHCLIIDNIFVGISSICDEIPENMPLSYMDQLVQMHPSTMQFTGLRIGQKVCIDNEIPAIVWPNPKLSVQTVRYGISKRSLKRYKLIEKVGISLVACKFKNLIPKEVIISINGVALDLIEEGGLLDLHRYISRNLVGELVKLGSVKKMNYFGRECSACIIQIDNQRAEPVSDELNASMASLNLSSADIVSSSKLKQLPFRKLFLPLHSGYCEQFYEIISHTKIKFNADPMPEKHDGDYEQRPIGGLDNELTAVYDVITRSLVVNQRHHLRCTGMLVHGVHGSGKTLLLRELCRRISNSSKITVLHLNTSEVWSKFYGESENKLISFFKEAIDSSPCLLCIEDVESLCGRRDQIGGTDVERRITSCFLNQMDLLASKDTMAFVLATTSKLDDLEPALLRSGRLDNELEINVPTATQRLQILEAILSISGHDLSNLTLSDASANTHGFVGSDLQSLCKEASVHAYKNGRHKIACDDLKFALGVIKPSAMREIAIEIPKVYWSDIGGQASLKHQLKQAIEWPLKHPESFKRLGIRPPKGLLMYGPPGCSKTLVAKALACESKLNFISIKGPELFSKWVGESEKAVREVFRKARRASPSIIFFDEIDALAGERSSGDSGDVSSRVLAQLLTEMDGVDSLNEVTVIAATNRPDRIDKALMRPGRLDRVVYVPLPDLETRQQIFAIRFARLTPVSGDSEVLATKLASLTPGYSGAEVVAVCEEACLVALENDLKCSEVDESCFLEALNIVKPRTTAESIAFYENYYNNSRK